MSGFELLDILIDNYILIYCMFQSSNTNLRALRNLYWSSQPAFSVCCCCYYDPLDIQDSH